MVIILNKTCRWVISHQQLMFANDQCPPSSKSNIKHSVGSQSVVINGSGIAYLQTVLSCETWFVRCITSLALLTWLSDLHLAFYSHCIIHNHLIQVLYGLLMYTVSEIKPPSIKCICMVGYCKLFKSPHSFRCIISSFIHNIQCIYHSSHYHVRQLLLLLLLLCLIDKWLKTISLVIDCIVKPNISVVRECVSVCVLLSFEVYQGNHIILPI